MFFMAFVTWASGTTPDEDGQVRQGEVPGTVDVIAKAVAHRACYEWQV
jgi:hypothetical protein